MKGESGEKMLGRGSLLEEVGVTEVVTNVPL